MQQNDAAGGGFSYDGAQPLRPIMGEFADRELEMHYRREHLGEDARTLLLLLAIVLPANALWLVSDYLVSASGPSFRVMAGVRAAIILCGLLSLVISFRTRSPKIFLGTVLLTAAAAAGGIFYFDLTRPNDYLGHYTIDIIVIVAIYLIAPMPVRWKLACAAVYSGAVLAVYALYKETAHRGLYNFNVALSICIANAMGYFASRDLAIRRRREFHLFHRESEARRQLQHALDNIKTLSGLVPICAACKKIRDDRGYWKHVEAYLAEHSEVAFTHGLCPDCSSSYRAELKPAD